MTTPLSSSLESSSSEDPFLIKAEELVRTELNRIIQIFSEEAIKPKTPVVRDLSNEN